MAQSLGGFSAPLAVDRLDVRRIVLLNAMVPKPGETFNEWWGAVGQQEASRAYAERDGRDPDAGWDEGELFFHDVPTEVTETVYSRGEPQQADKPCGEPWPLDAWPDVPTSAITGPSRPALPRAAPASLPARPARHRADGHRGGHLVALANPEGLAAVLLVGPDRRW